MTLETSARRRATKLHEERELRKFGTAKTLELYAKEIQGERMNGFLAGNKKSKTL
jgi:hypothetical protein